MIRRIVFILIILAFFGLLGFFYLKFQEKKVVEDDYFQAVPYQAAWIIDIKDPVGFYNDLKPSNIIYQDLIEMGILGDVDKVMNNLASASSSSPELFKAFGNSSLVVSMSSSGASSHDILYSLKVPDHTDEIAILKLLDSDLLTLETKPFKTYDGAEFYKFSFKGLESQMLASFFNDYLLVSTSAMVMEDAIRQLNSDVSIKDEPQFSSVYQTAGDKRAVNVFVNVEGLHEWVLQRVDTHHKQGFERMGNFSGWTALDLLSKPNSLLLNGYSYSNDSIRNYLSILEGQNEGRIEATKILPPNTAFFVHYSISDFKGWRKSYNEYLSAKNQLVSFRNGLAVFETDSAPRISEVFEDLSGSELVYAILEVPADINDMPFSAIGDRSLAVLRARDPESSLEKLSRFMKKHDGEAIASEYREVEIYELQADGLIGAFFGDLFHPMRNKFMAMVDGYLIFADLKSTLREVINAVKGDKTLEDDIHFQSFSDHLSASSNISVYANIARSPYLLSYFLDARSKTWIDEYLPLFRKFDGLAVQISREEGNRFYHNIFLSRNPIYKQITSSLWELPIDTMPSIRPQLFTNHYTKTKEIFVQDMNFKAYLISSTGRVLWTRQLDGIVQGGIEQVDRYKNNKYQLLLNTQNKVYLLDRNGKDVDGFPVKLKVPTRMRLSLMDYDKNRKYRILIPDTLGGISCYNIEGKQVKGWTYKRKSELTSRIEFMQVKRKDYLVATTLDGEVLVLNRKGERRVKLDHKIFKGRNAGLTLDKGKDLKTSYILTSDTVGNVLRLSLSGELENIQLNGNSRDQYFDFVDVDGDLKRDFLIQGVLRIQAFDQERNPVFTYSSSDSLTSGFQVYQIEDQSTLLALHSRIENRVQLVNSTGSRFEGSPFFGGYASVLSDVNLDGRIEFITISSEGMIYCYVLN